MNLDKIYKYVINIFITVILLWLFFVPIIYYSTKSWNAKDFQVISRIGDAFGVINSLFSGLALLGIVLTLFLQQKAYDLQKEKFEQTMDQFTEATLVSAYTKQLDWYFEERKRQLESSDSRLDDAEFEMFFSHIRDNLESYQGIIKANSEKLFQQELDK